MWFPIAFPLWGGIWLPEAILTKPASILYLPRPVTTKQSGDGEREGDPGLGRIGS